MRRDPYESGVFGPGLRAESPFLVAGALQHYFDHSATDEDIAQEIYHEDAVLEFRGDKVSRESADSTEAWEAPEWRARWRAAPPREPDGEPASAPAADAGGV